MKPDIEENKPSRQQKIMSFLKRKPKLIIALTLVLTFAAATGSSFFIELSYAGNCTSTVCTNGYKWIISPFGQRICVTC